MRHTINRYLFVLIGLVLLCIPLNLQAMTAHEILEQVFKQNFSDSFRVVLTVKTLKGKKVVSDHVLWLVGKTSQDTNTFFIDFVEPKESKGLRFLFELEPGKEPKAFMYIPAAGKTLPLDVDDPSVDIGATGLTMEDIQGFVPKGGEKETILRGRESRRSRLLRNQYRAARWKGRATALGVENRFSGREVTTTGRTREDKEDVPRS